MLLALISSACFRRFSSQVIGFVLIHSAFEFDQSISTMPKLRIVGQLGPEDMSSLLSQGWIAVERLMS